jgi:hypothetical protein
MQTESPRIITYNLLMLRKAAPLTIALALIAPGLQASPACMTKQEARAKWPTKPIYRHGSSHCWNDQPLSSRPSTTPFPNTSDSVTKSSQVAKAEAFSRSMIVSDMDLFNAAPMAEWRVLIGIDDLIGINGQAPDPNNGIDGCCWPSLDALKALIGAEK